MGENNLLLVEGTNDLHIISAFCGVHQIPKVFKIEDCGSDSMVLKKLDAYINSSVPINKIAIVLDADEKGFEQRKQSVEAILNRNDIISENIDYTNGAIIQSDNYRIGVWIMPNNQDYGRIEDFIIGLIDTKAIDYAKVTSIEAKSNKFGDFKDVHISKAIVHSYLAWQDEPGCPIGQSITKQVLKPHSETAQIFKNWLLNMFVD